MSETRILVVDDDRNQAEMLRKMLALEGYEVDVVHSGTQAVGKIAEGKARIVLSDLRMPDISGYDLFRKTKEMDSSITFIIMTAFGTVETAVQALKDGVFDYVQKPVNIDELTAIFDRAIEFQRLRSENAELRARIGASTADGARIIGRSPQMLGLLEQVDMVAASDATILLVGESGTGKELIANAIHEGSSRAGEPLIKVNCAAIPDTLLEDELFGHEKGAFTGAQSARKGRFERADKGTLFLDEIGEMPSHLQVKLLRILQEQEFERLGGSETVKVDVRLVAATNKNLEEMVEKGRFREDLYYRIAVIPLRLPPLRERTSDVLLLADHFLRKSAQKNRRTYTGFSPEAQDKMLAYSWPGNVRELENCIERAVVMGRDGEIGPELIAFHSGEDRKDRTNLVERLFTTDLSFAQLEKEIILMALDRARWNQSKAARLLGMTRRTLQYRMDKHEIVAKEGT
jgi:two-component system response regulator HydG